MGRDRQGDPERKLEPLQSVHWQAGPVAQQAQQHGHAEVVLLLAHARRRLGGEHLAAEVAAAALQFIDGRLDRGHPRDAQQGRGLLQGIDLAVGAVGTRLAARSPLQGHWDAPGLGIVVRAIAAMALRLLPLLLGTAGLALHGLLAHRRERFGFRAEKQVLQAIETDVLPACLIPHYEHGFDEHPKVVVHLALARHLAELGKVAAQFLRGDFPEPQVRTLGRRCRLLVLLVLAHNLNLSLFRKGTSEYKSNYNNYLD